MSIDGIELTFATNVLGYYLLTQDALDLLRASAPARIVNVASTFASDLDLADLQFDHRAYNGRKAYAQSKVCNRMLHLHGLLRVGLKEVVSLPMPWPPALW